MATTQYIGARYIPLFAEPLDWNTDTVYESLTIVYYAGNSYTSRQDVPKGIDISNEKYWALTGNYNAQIEQYRREVKAFDGRITENAQKIADEVSRAVAQEAAIKEIIEKEATRAKAAEKVNSDAIASETSRAKAAEKELKFENLINKNIFYRDDYFEQYYSASAPKNMYSTIQGLTGNDENLYVVQGPGSYWGANVYQNGYSNTNKLSVISKNTGAVVNTKIISDIGHANSLAYDKKRNVIYSTHMYDLNSSDTNWSAYIDIINPSTLSKESSFTISNPPSYFDGVSYDESSDTICLFSFDKFTLDFKAYLLDAESKSVTKTITLNGASDVYAQLLVNKPNTGTGNFFQSGFHTTDYLFAVCFHPNSFIMMDYDGELIKVIAVDEEDVCTYELEDVHYDASNGDIYMGAHKRFYNRSTTGDNTGEVHEDIETIYISNLLKNTIKEPIHEVADGFNLLYVNPSTTNTIQNGGENTPFKSVMAAIEYLQKPGYNPRIYLTGSGDVEWIRVTGTNLNLVKTSGYTGTVGTLYARDSDCYIENVPFKKVSGFLHHLYSTYGDVYFLNNCNVFISGGSMPSGSDDYFIVDKSIIKCQNAISSNATVAFRVTNASIAALNTTDSAKSTKSSSCLVNWS